MYAVSLLVGYIFIKQIDTSNPIINALFNSGFGMSVVIVVGIFVFMMNLTSIIAVSKDGKNSILIKYIPISLFNQFKYKISIGEFLNSIYVFELVLISSTVVNNFINLILLFIILELINILFEKMKFIIDVIKPKVKWENEYVMMKQNTNVMYILFFTIILAILCILLGFLITNIYIYLLLIFIVSFSFNILINKYIKCNDIKIFKKIH